MAIARKKKAPAGAPAWVLTYGDLVTLLLVFFVLLVSMMEVKSEQRVMVFMQVMREAFGYIGGTLQIPSDETEIPKNVEIMQILQIPIQPEDFSPTKDDGPIGQRPKVETMRPHDYFQSGGKFRFPELSAELPDDEKQRLVEFARRSLVGYATVIHLRGHCNKRPVDGTEFADHNDLSHRRARVIYDLLVAQGVDPKRLRTVAVGTDEPINVGVYDPIDREKNDLVEVLQLDQTIDEFEP